MPLERNSNKLRFRTLPELIGFISLDMRCGKCDFFQYYPLSCFLILAISFSSGGKG